MQVTVDAIMLPSQLSNCQEDVNQFLLTLGNLENVPHPPSPAQPPNTAIQEALPQELYQSLFLVQATCLLKACQSLM